jgi:PAS domain-containing protein
VNSGVTTTGVTGTATSTAPRADATTVPPVAADGVPSKSLPLILAQQLASNLATPMFLMDAQGTLVYFNDAAEKLIGRSFADLGEIPIEEFGQVLELNDEDGGPLRRRDTPAGIAFLQRRPAHRRVSAAGYDGVRRLVDCTAYPLFGKGEEMHGVVNVFWQAEPEGS